MDEVFDPKRDKSTKGVGRVFAGLAVAVSAVALLGGAAFFAQQDPTTQQPGIIADATALTSASVANLPTELTSVEWNTQLVSATARAETLGRRDTLADLFDRLDVARGDAYNAMNAAFEAEHLDPRRVRPGLPVEVFLEADDDGETTRLVGATFKPEQGRSVTVSRNQDGEFVSRETFTQLVASHRRITGEVTSTLYDAAIAAGATDQQVVDFAQIYAYDVDFQRELRVGDRFEIVYETFTDERGNPIRSGDVLYADFEGRFLDRDFYRFTPTDDGVTDYFSPNGESARKFLMKTPINGARLSSSFGKRRHPISGYTRMHKGTDFAARTGTPIMAAGNGVIERASRYGGYGKYVRIRHANGYKTAYAHMSRYGPGVKSGRRIKQGDIVGYVGSTGASTGPHLHYEVIKQGMHINAMTMKLPTGRKLEGEMFDLFNTKRSEIDTLRASLGAPLQAKVEGATDYSALDPIGAPTRKTALQK